MMKTTDQSAAARWRALFEERHGAGAYERLIADLGQPCVTFAAIAARLGVTREGVRKWQMRVLPNAPRGLRRRSLCAAYRQKRQLLQDPLLRAFYRHVRAGIAAGRIEFVKVGKHFQRRLVRIDGRLVALRPRKRIAPATGAANPAEHRLAPYRGVADFVYQQLDDDDYLLIPAQRLHARRVRFIDTPRSPYSEFKNTVAAVSADGGPALRACESALEIPVVS